MGEENALEFHDHWNRNAKKLGFKTPFGSGAGIRRVRAADNDYNADSNGLGYNGPSKRGNDGRADSMGLGY
jgi:hypothetical protein